MIEVNSVILAEALKQILTSNDRSKHPTRPVLAGVNLKLENDILTLASLDGYMITKYIVPVSNPEDDSWDVTVETFKIDPKSYTALDFEDGHLIIMQPGLRQSIKVFYDSYPKYDQMFPDAEPEYTISLDPAKLARLVKGLKETITLEFHGKLNPVVIKPAATDEWEKMLLPVRVNK